MKNMMIVHYTPVTMVTVQMVYTPLLVSASLDTQAIHAKLKQVCLTTSLSRHHTQRDNIQNTDIAKLDISLTLDYGEFAMVNLRDEGNACYVMMLS